MNDAIERKIVAEQKRFSEMLDRKLSGLISPSFAIEVMDKFYANEKRVEFIAGAKGIDVDFFRYNEMVQLNILLVIASIYSNVKQQGSDITSDALADELYYGILSQDLNILEDSTIFLSNPIISNILTAVKAIKEHTIKNNDLYRIMLNNILDSIHSVFILFDKRCYTQAMSVFRQALEHFITMKALDMNPNALESYLRHQEVTAADVLGEMTPEDLDNYIKENNLTYNTYKSYMNYGWLDEVEAFQRAKLEKPKLKYSIKTITDITGQQEFYEAMDFASNYVHPNFIFVSVDWDMVIAEVVDGTYQMLDWAIEWLDKNNLKMMMNECDYIEIYNHLKSFVSKVISVAGYSFNIK